MMISLDVDPANVDLEVSNLATDLVSLQDRVLQ